MIANSIPNHDHTRAASGLRCCRCGEALAASAAVHTQLGYACADRARPNSNIRHVDSGRLNAKRDMVHGALWFCGGVAVTLFTYGLSASSGGHFIVAWGAIVFGAIQFIRGLLNR